MKDLNTEPYITLVGEIAIGTGAEILPVNQQKTVSPSKEEVVVRPDTGYTGLSKVTVSAVTSEIDANIKPENIKKGVTILGVTGTYESIPSAQPYYEDNSLVFSDGSIVQVMQNNTLEIASSDIARVEGEELIF